MRTKPVARGAEFDNFPIFAETVLYPEKPVQYGVRHRPIFLAPRVFSRACE